jgi:tRNA A-37 threonylcarbamoyl transferase component Bud32
VVEEDGVRAIVKDFSTSRFVFRNTAGRFLVWREARAYKRMKDLEGVPALYGTINGLALVIREIPGTSIEDLEDRVRIPETFFSDLKDLVSRIHARGLAHCDLKRAPNTIVGHRWQPFIIDWGASIAEREFRPFPLNLIYRRFLRDDYIAIVKMKLRHIPDKVTREERDLYYRRSRLERLMRSIRDRLRGIVKKIA